MAGAAHSYENASGYAKSKGYSQKEFDDWYAKNQGAVSANEGSGGDFGRIEAAFGGGKAVAGLQAAASAPATTSPAPTGGLPPAVGGGGPIPAPASPVEALAGLQTGKPTETSIPGVGALRPLGQRTPPAGAGALAGLKRIY